MGLDRFNAAAAEDAIQSLLTCCDVPRWARSVAQGRPYRDVTTLLAAADEAARGLSGEEVDKALAAHPRIGERAEGSGADAAFSRQEQSGVDSAESTKGALRDGNLAYEERFGRVFLICATGLSSAEVLSSLRGRLENDEETETAVVADELRKIALLRLRGLVEREEERV